MVGLLAAPLISILLQQRIRLGMRRARPARNTHFCSIQGAWLEGALCIVGIAPALLQLANHEDVASRELDCVKTSQPIRLLCWCSQRGRPGAYGPTHGELVFPFYFSFLPPLKKIFLISPFDIFLFPLSSN